MTSLPPRLTGRNVILRPWRISDVPDLHREIQDPEIVRWLNIQLPYTKTDAQRFINATAARWKEQQAAHFVIGDTDGRLVGYIAALPLGEALDEVEVVYWVASAERGRGVAGDALNTLVRWLADEVQPTTIELGMVDGNLASAAVAESSGFVLRGISNGSGWLDGEPADERIYEWPSRMD